MTTKVVLQYLDGRDKVTLLNDVLHASGLFDELEKIRKSIGKDKDDFQIAIKPNASMFVRRDDDGVTTDPILVLALVEWLHGQGFKNISVVESSNAYELTYTERNPVTVMTAMGLNGGVHSYVSARSEMTAHVANASGELLPYRLVDLGADTVEVKSDAMPHGKLKLGSAWVKSDFRISFAKFKTHVYGGYTLLVKNTYGCLPEGDKMWHYHKQTGCAKPTIEQLKICPVHFGIIDGVIAADGWMGVKWDRAIPRRPGFIVAGRNIGETERVACRIMGVKVERSLMTESALDFLGEPAELEGEIRPLGKWWNVPGFIVSGFPITEKYYRYYTIQQTLTDGLGSHPFHRKPVGLILSYLLIAPVLIYMFHRRHWIFRIMKDMKLRISILTKKKAPRRVRSSLDRLDAPELEVLLDCLKSDSLEAPVVFGYKVLHHDSWYMLPDSTFSRLVRIPEIIEKLQNASERSDCIREVEARLGVLKM